MNDFKFATTVPLHYLDRDENLRIFHMPLWARWTWLAAPLRKLWNALSTPRTIQRVTITTLSNADFTRLIRTALHKLSLHDLSKQDIERVIFGGDVSEHVEEFIESKFYTYGIDVELVGHFYDGTTTIFGVPVQFVPWVRGVFIIPKLRQGIKAK